MIRDAIKAAERVKRRMRIARLPAGTFDELSGDRFADMTREPSDMFAILLVKPLEERPCARLRATLPTSASGETCAYALPDMRQLKYLQECVIFCLRLCQKCLQALRCADAAKKIFLRLWRTQIHPCAACILCANPLVISLGAE